MESQHTPAVRLGLKENWRQFSLLIMVNAFVGGMIGLERTVVPLIGAEQFGLVLKTAIFSFIVSFGVVKAFSNLVSGAPNRGALLHGQMAKVEPGETV